MRSWSLWFGLWLACGLATPAWSADPPAGAPAPISYYRQVRPVLQRACTGCHQPAKAGGGLLMTSHALSLKGGEQGALWVPGQPENSLLIEVVTGDPPYMPKNAPALSKEQVELLRKWIAEGAKDDTPTEVEDQITPENPPVYHSLPVITALAWSPDGQWLAVSGFREVLLHKADGSGLAGRLVGRSQSITSVAFSPDGKLLAATGGNPALFGEIQFWNVADRKLERSATVSTDTLFGGRFSPDGSLFACGGADNSARIFKVADASQQLKFDAHADWVLNTAFSVDGKHMITVSRDRSMKLSIVESGQFVDNITSAASSSHPRRVAVRRGRRGTEAVQDDSHTGPTDWRRLQPDPGLRPAPRADLRPRIQPGWFQVPRRLEFGHRRGRPDLLHRRRQTAARTSGACPRGLRRQLLPRRSPGCHRRLRRQDPHLQRGIGRPRTRVPARHRDSRRGGSITRPDHPPPSRRIPPPGFLLFPPCG